MCDESFSPPRRTLCTTSSGGAGGGAGGDAGGGTGGGAGGGAEGGSVAAEYITQSDETQEPGKQGKDRSGDLATEKKGKEAHSRDEPSQWVQGECLRA